MAKERDKGSFGQKNYSQMGDKHSSGHENIIKNDTSHAKPEGTKWTKHVQNHPKDKQISAAKQMIKNRPKPTAQTKTISKVKQPTKSR